MNMKTTLLTKKKVSYDHGKNAFASYVYNFKNCHTARTIHGTTSPMYCSTDVFCHAYVTINYSMII